MMDRHQMWLSNVEDITWRLAHHGAALDFGSLLGLTRGDRAGVTLGGDIDIAVPWSPGLVGLMGRLEGEGTDMTRRQWGHRTLSYKIHPPIEGLPPMDIKIYRQHGPNMVAHAAYPRPWLPGKPTQALKLVYRLQDQIMGRHDHVQLKRWLYRPMCWHVPTYIFDTQVLKRDTDRRWWPVSAHSEEHLKTHYGESWKIPYKGPWRWWNSHASSHTGTEADPL